jgi:hypothetical protein
MPSYDPNDEYMFDQERLLQDAEEHDAPNAIGDNYDNSTLNLSLHHKRAPWSSSLTELDYRNALNRLLQRKQLTPDDCDSIIMLDLHEVIQCTGLDKDRAEEFLVLHSYQICSRIPTRTALNLRQDENACRRLTVGCANFDRYLAGGLPKRTITEMFGEAGAGKTALALQISLQTQLPPEKGGLGGKTCYIATEGSFPMKRLAQLAQGFKEKHK